MTQSMLNQVNVERFLALRNELFREPAKRVAVATVLSALNEDDDLTEDARKILAFAVVGFWALTVPDISLDSIKSKQRICTNCGGLLNLD